MFSISNGQIIDPNGNVFIAKGINIDSYQADIGKLALFPQINMIRLPFHSYDSPSSITTFIQQTTAKNIVVAIEDHTGISAGPYTGSQLNTELAWYTSMAKAFNGNPYVWFGTLNEPGNGSNLPAIFAQEQAIYNAIRATGNQTIILLELPSGGNPGTIGTNGKGYDGSAPMTGPTINMTNVVWDFHFYNWGTKYSTDPATIKSYLLGSVSGGYGIAACQSVKSNDGVIPVIVGEFGVSTTGSLPDDPGGVALVDLVCQTTGVNHNGFLAWAWSAGGTSDNLTSNGNLTTYGKQVAGYIASSSPTPLPVPPPTPTPPIPTPPNYITPGVGSFTDDAGNVFTILANGNAMENNIAIASGAGTIAMQYYNKKVYGQDGSSKNWYIWDGISWTIAAPPGSPTPPPTPTPPSTVPPLVVAPIANAQTGQWMAMDIAGPGLRSMHFNFLLPHGWNPNNSYGILVDEHENSEGDNYYFGNFPKLTSPQSAGGNDYLPNSYGPEKWYNNVAFRTNYPFIIVVPYCNQTTDPGGVTSNFGGWTSQDDNEDNVVACVKWVIAHYSGHPDFVCITGSSLGGIGSWAAILDYNKYNGPKGKIYCAAVPLAGVIERSGMLAPDVINRMKQVPVFAISGAGDTTSRVQDYNQPYWNAMAPQLSGQYPGPNGKQAPGTKFWYLQDPNLGHNVWDTYRPQNFWKDWLMTLAPVPVPTPPTPPPTPPTPPPPTPTPPSPVTGIKATVATVLSWNLVPGAVSYTPAYKASNDSAWTKLPVTTSLSTSLPLEFGKTYNYSVVANMT